MVEEQILTGLRNRDRGAFEYFWNRYYQRVLSICTYILGDGPDAVDVTVDILVDFVEKYAMELETPRAMYSFLRQMAVRRSIRLRDKREKHTHIERDSQVGAEDSTPEEEAEISQLMPLLSRCLENMTPKTQISLRLKYSNKISNEQIGRVVGGSKSYIGRLLSKGREALRKCIEKKLTDIPTMSFKGSSQKILKPAVTLQVVDRLLSARQKEENGACPEIEKMAAATLDAQNRLNQKWAASHLLACEECREAAVWLQAVDAAQIPSSKSGMRDRNVVVRKIIPFAAAASVLFAVSFLFYNLRETAGYEEGDLVAKGAGDSLYVAVQRGDSKFTVHPLDRLMTDDKLGLFYSSDKNGYLAIFSRDGNGDWSLLVPTSGTSSAAISQGEKVPLTDGAIVSKGKGCEWLVAVFSDSPLHIDEIKGALAKSKVQGEKSKCGLHVKVQDARAVRVLPVRR